MKEGKKILIVDDERFNINVLADLLKPNYKIMVAINGKQALKAAQSDSPPDLILLDVMMPEMDGYEVCLQLKANKNTRAIPVIFVTAMGQESDETKGLKIGAVDYITKPISPAIVEARVRVQLERKEAEEAVAAAHARINHILASSPAVVYSFEATGDNAPTFASGNIRDVFGYEPSDYLEDRNFVPDRIHPDPTSEISSG